MSNIDLRMTSVRPMSKDVVGKGCKEYTIFIDSIHLSRLKTLATRTSPASVMMNKKRVRFASHAQVCAVTRLEDPTLGNVRLSYSREEYDGFKRGVVRDVQLFRFRRRKGFPVDNRVTFFTETTTVGIEQLLREKKDGPKATRSAHRGAIMKAQRHAAMDEFVGAEKFLRDVSLCYSRDAAARARIIGIGQSQAI